MNAKLTQKVMRRIYIAYAMRMLAGSRARHIALMVLAGAGLLKLVSVVDVLRNFSHVTVGQAGDFIVSAFINADTATLAVLAVFAYATFAFVRAGKITVGPAQFA